MLGGVGGTFEVRVGAAEDCDFLDEDQEAAADEPARDAEQSVREDRVVELWQ